MKCSDVDGICGNVGSATVTVAGAVHCLTADVSSLRSCMLLATPRYSYYLPTCRDRVSALAANFIARPVGVSYRR